MCINLVGMHDIMVAIEIKIWRTISDYPEYKLSRSDPRGVAMSPSAFYRQVLLEFDLNTDKIA